MELVEEKINDPNFETFFKSSVCKQFKISDEDCSKRYDEVKVKISANSKTVRMMGAYGGYGNYKQKSKSNVVIIKDTDRRRDNGLRDILPLLLIPLLTNKNNVPPVIPERNRETIDPLLLSLLFQQQQTPAQTFFPINQIGSNPQFINVPPGICRVFFNCVNCQC